MKPSRVDRGALALATCASVLPLLAERHLPFTDLPEHVALIAAIRHWFDPLWDLAGTYEWSLLRTQYVVYHGFGALLSATVGSPELGNRVLLVLLCIAFPFSFRALLRAFDRDERCALFAPLIFWNRALVVGFLPFVASIPLMLFGLALFVRAPSSPSRAAFVRGNLALGFVTLVLVLTHLSTFVVFAAIVSTLAIEKALRTEFFAESGKRPFRPRLHAAILEILRRVAFLSPSALLGFAWIYFGKITLQSDSLKDFGEIGSMHARRASRALFLWSQDIWQSKIDDFCAVGFWIIFIAVLVQGLREKKGGTLSPLLPFLVTLLVFFVTPFRVGAGSMLNVRLAPLVTLLAVVALPRTALGGRILLFLLPLSLVSSGNNIYEVRKNAAELGDIDGLLDSLPSRARITVLNFADGLHSTYYPPYVHIGAIHRARHGGVATFSFSELNHWPLRFKSHAAPPKKPYTFWDFDPCLFRNSSDGYYYDYVLVRGNVDPFHNKPPGPSWRRSDTTADFSLYQKIVDGSVVNKTPAPTFEEAEAIGDFGPCGPAPNRSSTPPYAL